MPDRKQTLLRRLVATWGLVVLVAYVVAAAIAADGKLAWTVGLGLGGLFLVLLRVIDVEDLLRTRSDARRPATAAEAATKPNSIQQGVAQMHAVQTGNQAPGFTIWFTGLPSSGKSTLARMVWDRLTKLGYRVEVLDGDEVRRRLTKGLGFSKADRDTNIDRIAFVAAVITRAGGVAVACAISPYREARDAARKEIGRFVEVYVECPVEVCIRRDVKGLYQKAIAGEIPNFTGVNDPYEPPLNPEVVVHTAVETPEESTNKIIDTLRELGYVTDGRSPYVNVSLPRYLVEKVKAHSGAASDDVTSQVIQLLEKAVPSTASESAIDPEARERALGRLRESGYLPRQAGGN